MSSINNLEKLIQIATIEQMYELIKKMKNNVDKENELDNFTKNNNDIILDLQNKIQELNCLVRSLTSQNQSVYNMVDRLFIRVENLEKELSDIQHNKEHDNQYLCAQLRGQQLLTSYPGFSKESKNNKLEEEENIKLKIEEKHQFDIATPSVLEDESDVESEGADDEAESGDSEAVEEYIEKVKEEAIVSFEEVKEEAIVSFDEVNEETVESEEEEESEEEVGIRRKYYNFRKR